jgi:dual specificity tyrosine-phosphorylation-regulated kinase 2/3/4
LCIVTELLSMTLNKLTNPSGSKEFPVDLIRKYLLETDTTNHSFALQLLRALVFLGNLGVVHCDLKPENIVLVHPLKSEIKIIDFGSSCLESKIGLTFNDIN